MDYFSIRKQYICPTFDLEVEEGLVLVEDIKVIAHAERTTKKELFKPLIFDQVFKQPLYFLKILSLRYPP